MSYDSLYKRPERDNTAKVRVSKVTLRADRTLTGKTAEVIAYENGGSSLAFFKRDGFSTWVRALR